MLKKKKNIHTQHTRSRIKFNCRTCMANWFLWVVRCSVCALAVSFRLCRHRLPWKLSCSRARAIENHRWLNDKMQFDSSSTPKCYSYIYTYARLMPHQRAATRWTVNVLTASWGVYIALVICASRCACSLNYIGKRQINRTIYYTYILIISTPRSCCSCYCTFRSNHLSFISFSFYTKIVFYTLDNNYCHTKRKNIFGWLK